MHSDPHPALSLAMERINKTRGRVFALPLLECLPEHNQPIHNEPIADNKLNKIQLTFKAFPT
jgi:hypothetical protein